MWGRVLHAIQADRCLLSAARVADITHAGNSDSGHLAKRHPMARSQDAFIRMV
jgi:hypothetical protein